MSEVKVVRDEQGNAIVIIPDIIFWNKQDIDWDAVKEYLKKYLGEIIENKQTKEKIEIGTKFADEYTGSKYSEHIRSTGKSQGKCSTRNPRTGRISCQ